MVTTPRFDIRGDPTGQVRVRQIDPDVPFLDIRGDPTGGVTTRPIPPGTRQFDIRGGPAGDVTVQQVQPETPEEAAARQTRELAQQQAQQQAGLAAQEQQMALATQQKQEAASRLLREQTANFADRERAESEAPGSVDIAALRVTNPHAVTGPARQALMAAFAAQPSVLPPSGAIERLRERNAAQSEFEAQAELDAQGGQPGPPKPLAPVQAAKPFKPPTAPPPGASSADITAHQTALAGLISQSEEQVRGFRDAIAESRAQEFTLKGFSKALQNAHTTLLQRQEAIAFGDLKTLYNARDTAAKAFAAQQKVETQRQKETTEAGVVPDVPQAERFVADPAPPPDSGAAIEQWRQNTRQKIEQAQAQAMAIDNALSVLSARAFLADTPVERSAINARKTLLTAQAKIAAADIKALRDATEHETKATTKAAETARKEAEAERKAQEANDRAVAEATSKVGDVAAASKANFQINQQLAVLTPALRGFKHEEADAESRRRKAERDFEDTGPATKALTDARDAQTRITAMVDALKEAKGRGKGPLPVQPDEQADAIADFIRLDTKSGKVYSRDRGVWSVEPDPPLVFDASAGKWLVEIEGSWFYATVGTPPQPTQPANALPRFFDLTGGPPRYFVPPQPMPTPATPVRRVAPVTPGPAFPTYVGPIQRIPRPV